MQLKVQIPAALPPLSLSREPQVRLTQVSPSVTWVPRFPSIAQAPPTPTLFISNSDLLPLLMPSRGLRITEQVLPGPPQHLHATPSFPAALLLPQGPGSWRPFTCYGLPFLPSSLRSSQSHCHTTWKAQCHPLPSPTPPVSSPGPAPPRRLMLSVFLPVHHLSPTQEGKRQEGRHLVSPSVQGSVSHKAGPQ